MMKNIVSLFVISVVLIPNMANARREVEETRETYKSLDIVETPTQRCEVCKAIANGSASDSQLRGYTMLFANYSAAQTKAQNNPDDYLFYEVPNQACSDQKYASTIYLQTEEPCSSLTYDQTQPLKLNNSIFCQYELGLKIDSAMIQEYARATHPKYRLESYATSKKNGKQTVSYEAKFYSKNAAGNRYTQPVVYFVLDTQRPRNGKYRKGLVVGEISKTPLSYYEKVEQWCKMEFGYDLDATFNLKKLEKSDNQYICDGYALQNENPKAPKKWNYHYEKNGEGAQYCRALNKFISNIQKSASDPTLIGASAEWTPNGLVNNKQKYDCVITIPQQ